VRTLGEIPAPAASPLRAGTLRRADQEAFGRLLGELAEVRVVLVTGERPRKRAAAAGLAAAAAAAGRRTALLECDLAEPTLADELGVAPAPGLREYLRGEAEAARILRPLVLAGPGSASAREPLVCVVAGRPGEDGDALLASDGFRQALAGLRDAHELVVAEGPPGLAAADLAAAASQAESTLLCLGVGEEVPALPVGIAGVIRQRRPAAQRS
jgi:Mrp family chromosome partitioning ATPase